MDSFSIPLEIKKNETHLFTIFDNVLRIISEIHELTLIQFKAKLEAFYLFFLVFDFPKKNPRDESIYRRSYEAFFRAFLGYSMKKFMKESLA